MDVISHALWAGAAAQVARRRWRVTRRTVAWTVALGVLPDLVMLVPVVSWSLFQPDALRLIYDFVRAIPGREPYLPPLVVTLSHHAHCILHSAPISIAVTAVAWWLKPRLLFPLMGWWLHIVIDIPTHSSGYYAVPFLYPFTYRGVDGIAWTTPWVLIANYAVLAFIYWRLAVNRGRRGMPA
jgi:hypothetical protein